MSFSTISTTSFRHLILILLMVYASAEVWSQNMQVGFTYLEQGEFDKAELFFENILEEFPNNKTAQLCYARAVGLNGQPALARDKFADLLQTYPQDYEIQLNFAESLLWTKDYDNAKDYYAKLLATDSTSFSARLGYANALSNLRHYDEALSAINKALERAPENENALISRKYIRLGLAKSKLDDLKFSEAWSLYELNLNDFPNDIDTILNMLNWCFLKEAYGMAAELISTLYTIDRPLALTNEALLLHLKNRNKKALQTISKGFSIKLIDDLHNDKNRIIVERFVQALIWNAKYQEANNLISTLERNVNSKWVRSLRAMYYIYKSDFELSTQAYQNILSIDSLSFDGNLGLANSYKALNYINKAYDQADRTLLFYNNQKDVMRFIQTLDNQYKPDINLSYSYNVDNGNNEANNIEFSIRFPLSTKFEITSNISQRATINTVTETSAETLTYTGGLKSLISNKITFTGSIGLTNGQSANNDYNTLISQVTLNLTPFKLQNIAVGYERQVQNFNSDLIARSIVMNNYYANYNLATNKNVGAFVQYYFTNQNDDNTRNLFFASVFYSLLKMPTLKVGLNYQNITFKLQRPTLYFSPSNFNAYEVFLNLNRDIQQTIGKSWYYNVNLATGVQKIESNSNQGTYRIEGTVGYKFDERLNINFFGTHSNIASTTAAGFIYTALGINLHWDISRKPTFRIN